MYRLTENGLEKVKVYRAEALAKQKEILDAAKDTVDDMFIPDEDDVTNDINGGYVEEDGTYEWLWSVTDNYSMDYPLELVRNEDFA